MNIDLILVDNILQHELSKDSKTIKEESFPSLSSVLLYLIEINTYMGLKASEISVCLCWLSQTVEARIIESFCSLFPILKSLRQCYK